VVSGTLLDFFSWRSVFAVNIVLAVAALVGTVRIVPESANPDAPRLDRVGAFLSVAGLVVLVYSIIEAPTVGWLGVRTLGGIALGLVVLALFVVVELRQQRPLLDPRIFRRRRLSAGTLSIFVQFFGFYGFIFLILQYLQLVRHDSALTAALSMLPMAVAMMPTSRLAPRLADRFSARRVCVVGLTLIAVAFMVIAKVGRETDYWVLAVGLLVLGAGMGAAMTPATSAITAAMPRAQQGVASAMNDLAREVGGALGIAVLGSIVAATYRTHLDVGSLPEGEAGAVRDSLAAAAHLGGPVGVSADGAYVDGVHLALHVAAVVALVAAIAVAALLPRHDDTAAGSGEAAQA
jgi:predicted MFS family arabinose efflux permease